MNPIYCATDKPTYNTNITMLRVCNAYIFYHAYFLLTKPIFPAMKKILVQIQTIGPQRIVCNFFFDNVRNRRIKLRT